MPQDDEKKRPVEGKRGQPEPLRPPVNRPSRSHLGLGVPEEGAEKKNLQSHPPDHFRSAMGVLQGVGLDPGKGFLLPAGSGDAERNRGSGPDHNPIRRPREEDEEGRIGDDDSEQEISPHPGHSAQGYEHQKEDGKERKPEVQTSALRSCPAHRLFSPSLILSRCTFSRHSE